MPLKIQYCSDLHLEFEENKAFLKTHSLQPQGSVLVLAGDIMPFSETDRHTEFFNEVADKFETVYWVPGNHEYYHFDAAKKSGTFREKIRSNFFLVNNITLFQHNVRFVFSTLWSKISELHEWQIEKGINDFRLIKYNGSRFSAAQFNEFHTASRDFIEKETATAYSGKTVVVSHHVPTLLNYPEKYKNSIFSEAFGVELADLIERSNIDYWIYGHHHSNVPDFTIGNTHFLTNQLGYVRYNEQKLFDRAKIIEII